MDKKPDTVSYVIHEATIARFQDEINRIEHQNQKDRERDERKFNKVVIALVISVVLIFACNIGWLIYESMYDTITYEQDGQGLNNINTGKQGDVVREPESAIQTEKEREGDRSKDQKTEKK